MSKKLSIFVSWHTKSWNFSTFSMFFFSTFSLLYISFRTQHKKRWHDEIKEQTARNMKVIKSKLDYHLIFRLFGDIFLRTFLINVANSTEMFAIFFHFINYCEFWFVQWFFLLSVHSLVDLDDLFTHNFFTIFTHSIDTHGKIINLIESKKKDDGISISVN